MFCLSRSSSSAVSGSSLLEPTERSREDRAKDLREDKRNDAARTSTIRPETVSVTKSQRCSNSTESAVKRRVERRGTERYSSGHRGRRGAVPLSRPTRTKTLHRGSNCNIAHVQRTRRVSQRSYSGTLISVPDCAVWHIYKVCRRCGCR